MVRTLAVCLCLAVTFSTALADDAVKTKLDTARAKYKEKIATAKSGFLDTASESLDKERSRGAFENLQLIEKQIHAFKNGGITPTKGPLKSAATKYRTDVRNAERVFMNQLQRARTAFTRAGKLDEASAVDIEFKELEANRNLAPANDDALQHPFEEGAIWHGMRRMPRGGLVPYELHIGSRNGNKFDGHAFGYQGNRWEIEGTIDVDTIKWQVVGGNRVGDTFVGKLNGTDLVYTFKGVNDDKEGRATLTLRKPGKAPAAKRPN